MAYTYAKNRQKNHFRVFTQEITADMTLAFLQKAYLNAHYGFFYHKVMQADIAPFTGGLLNLNAGLRLWKGGLDVGVAVYDLLNRTTHVRTSVNSGYVMTTYTPTFGRYISLNLVFRIDSVNKEKSLFHLSDGRPQDD